MCNKGLAIFMNINVNINLFHSKKRYPPEKEYEATDLRNLVKIGSSLFNDKPYMCFKRNKQDCSVSFRVFDKMIDCVGTAFSECGIMGKTVAVIGETTPEWVMTYLATVNGGGVIVPLDKELAPEEIANFLRRADVCAVVYSHNYRRIFQEIGETMPEIKLFVEISKETFPYPPEHSDEPAIQERYIPFAALVRRGATLLARGNIAFTAHNIDVEKMCSLLFTSGTTGTSKGVMLSQKNIITAVNAAFRMIRISSEDVLVSVLPIHHTYEMSTTILVPLLVGCTIGINDSIKNAMRSFQQYRPTILVLVPLFVSTIYKKIWDTAKRNGLDKKLRLAIAASDKTRLFGLDLRKTLFRQVLDALGGRLDRIVCGGAPLNPELVKAFDSLGINLTQGYGITECSPLISVSPFDWKKGASVGLPVPGMEVRIDADNNSVTYGEIVVRGDNVMLGYYNDPEKTAEVLTPDGWFRTGDVGYIDRDGFLYITGRKKNVIVLHNGKNIFPEEIEEYLEPVELISECAVVGRTADDGDTINLTAIIYPDFDVASAKGLTDIDAISKAIHAEINQINTKLPLFKQIRCIELRKTPFIKTSSHKIIRHKIDQPSA